MAPLRRRLDARMPGRALDLMTDTLEDSSRLPEALEVRMDGLRSGPLGLPDPVLFGGLFAVLAAIPKTVMHETATYPFW